jgi:hypothetical protein
MLLWSCLESILMLFVVACVGRPLHILREFFNIRMIFYERRKTFLVKRLTAEWDKLDNKVCVPEV